MLLISPKEGLYFQMTYIKDYCESRKNFPLVKVDAFSCNENDLSFGDSQLQCHIKQALAKICLVAGSLTVTDLWVKPMMLFLPRVQVLGSGSGVFIVHIASYMSELFQLFRLCEFIRNRCMFLHVDSTSVWGCYDRCWVRRGFYSYGPISKTTCFPSLETKHLLLNKHESRLQLFASLRSLQGGFPSPRNRCVRDSASPVVTELWDTVGISHAWGSWLTDSFCSLDWVSCSPRLSDTEVQVTLFPQHEMQSSVR